MGWIVTISRRNAPFTGRLHYIIKPSTKGGQNYSRLCSVSGLLLTEPVLCSLRLNSRVVLLVIEITGPGLLISLVCQSAFWFEMQTADWTYFRSISGVGRYPVVLFRAMVWLISPYGRPNYLCGCGTFTLLRRYCWMPWLRITWKWLFRYVMSRTH